MQKSVALCRITNAEIGILARLAILACKGRSLQYANLPHDTLG